MVDLGALRRPSSLSMDATYVPQLYGQIKADMQTHFSTQAQIDEMLLESMKSLAKAHKSAIVQRLNKRQDAKKEEMKAKKAEEDAKRQRQEKRAQLREQHRLALLKDQLLKEVINTGVMNEYSSAMKVYDIRDPAATNDGIILIGGFVGELIITFTCLLDYILASPQNQNYRFTQEMMEKFLVDLLLGEGASFPNGICSFNISKSIKDLTEGEDITPSAVAKILRD